MSKVVCSVKIDVTEVQLDSFIKVINRVGDDDPLTKEEVLSNAKLLEYICESAVKDGTAMYDPLEAYNEGVWDEWKEYR